MKEAVWKLWEGVPRYSPMAECKKWTGFDWRGGVLANSSMTHEGLCVNHYLGRSECLLVSQPPLVLEETPIDCLILVQSKFGCLSYKYIVNLKVYHWIPWSICGSKVTVRIIKFLHNQLTLGKTLELRVSRCLHCPWVCTFHEYQGGKSFF